MITDINIMVHIHRYDMRVIPVTATFRSDGHDYELVENGDEIVAKEFRGRDKMSPFLIDYQPQDPALSVELTRKLIQRLMRVDLFTIRRIPRKEDET